MKVFLVETLLNLVIYVCNVHSKNTEAPLPFIIISTIVPNDTRIHGHRILKVPGGYDQFQLLNKYVSTILYKNEQRKNSNR